MLLRNLSNFNIVQTLYFLVVFLITITVHEVAHGYTAYKLGDPTARNMGRLTLNPIKHIDIIGFIMIMLIGFGWAKPVPINPRNFRNPQKGMAISALAGPASNFCMAIIGMIFFRISYIALLQNFIYVDDSNFWFNFLISCVDFFRTFLTLNIWFGLFNLLPVPPLDGSRIVSYFLPPRLSYQYAQIERYGFIVLIALLYTGILSRPLMWFSDRIISVINFVLDLIPFLRLG